MTGTGVGRMTEEWRSHLDRSEWEPEVLAEVEAAEERMAKAIHAARRERGAYIPEPMQVRPKTRPR